MKKIACLIATFLLISSWSFAADDEGRTVRQFKVTPLAPGFEAELPLHRTGSLVIRPAAGCGFVYDSEEGLVAAANVYANFQYRVYTNLGKKFAQSGVNNNSGSFVALSCALMKEFYTNNDNYDLNDMLAIGALWGMQWTTNRNIFWRFNVGLSAGYTADGDSALLPTTEFCVGYVFGKRK